MRQGVSTAKDAAAEDQSTGGRWPTMTLDQAIAAVEATLDSVYLRVDRRLAREDAWSFLLLVLDTSHGRDDGVEAVANGPRLVDKLTGDVVRLTVPAAVAQAERMVIIRS